MAKRRRLEHAGFGVRAVVGVLKPLLVLLTKPRWTGIENIPLTGGCVIVVNHVTQADPGTAAHFVWNSGRVPHFLAKESLFRVPIFGMMLRTAEQIPVHRGGSQATEAFRSAIQAVKDGKCVVIFPEGSTTKDPEQWPMRLKTGAARIAIITGCPVIPAGQWGIQEFLPAYQKPRLWPPKRYPVKVAVGAPVDLEGVTDTHEANIRIWKAITAQVAVVRGLEAPEKPFDPKGAGVSEIGDHTKGLS